MIHKRQKSRRWGTQSWACYLLSWQLQFENDSWTITIPLGSEPHNIADKPEYPRYCGVNAGIPTNNNLLVTNRNKIDISGSTDWSLISGDGQY